MSCAPRYNHIKSKMIRLLRSLPAELLKFPVDVKGIIDSLEDCKAVSYQTFASDYHLSIDDVVCLCQSQIGCTHYDRNCQKYLILFNDSSRNYNVSGRQLWTLAHELGHVILGHHLLAPNALGYNSSPVVQVNITVESEANFFASELLAPFPLFDSLTITSPIDIKNFFGLSMQASRNQYEQYVKWKSIGIKRSYDAEIVKLYSPILTSYQRFATSHVQKSAHIF